MAQDPQLNPLAKFLGGSPREVLVKLVIFSLIVGVFLSWWGLNPYNLLHSIENLFHYIWNFGFEFAHGLWRYFLLGAVIVVPLWLLMRIFGGFSQKPFIETKITIKTNSQSKEKGLEGDKPL